MYYNPLVCSWDVPALWTWALIRSRSSKWCGAWTTEVCCLDCSLNALIYCKDAEEDVHNETCRSKCNIRRSRCGGTSAVGRMMIDETGSNQILAASAELPSCLVIGRSESCPAEFQDLETLFIPARQSHIHHARSSLVSYECISFTMMILYNKSTTPV